MPKQPRNPWSTEKLVLELPTGEAAVALEAAARAEEAAETAREAAADASAAAAAAAGGGGGGGVVPTARRRNPGKVYSNRVLNRAGFTRDNDNYYKARKLLEFRRTSRSGPLVKLPAAVESEILGKYLGLEPVNFRGRPVTTGFPKPHNGLPQRGPYTADERLQVYKNRLNAAERAIQEEDDAELLEYLQRGRAGRGKRGSRGGRGGRGRRTRVNRQNNGRKTRKN